MRLFNPKFIRDQFCKQYQIPANWNQETIQIDTILSRFNFDSGNMWSSIYKLQTCELQLDFLGSFGIYRLLIICGIVASNSIIYGIIFPLCVSIVYINTLQQQIRSMWKMSKAKSKSPMTITPSPRLLFDE